MSGQHHTGKSSDLVCFPILHSATVFYPVNQRKEIICVNNRVWYCVLPIFACKI